MSEDKAASQDDDYAALTSTDAISSLTLSRFGLVSEPPTLIRKFDAALVADRQATASPHPATWLGRPPATSPVRIRT